MTRMTLAALAACCCAGVTPRTWAGTYFATRVDYAAATPDDVAIGDVNGDGHLDLVSPCGNADSLAVFFGNGDGTFQSRHSIATGPSPQANALADMNGDQKLDIIVVEYGSNSFSVMLGNGDGTFGPRMVTSGGPGGPLDVAIGYLDGDSNLDVALTHLVPHGFSVYLGHGDGTFEPPVFYGTSNAPTAGITLGDLNGDGHQDVIAATGTHLVVYLGTGVGTLTFSKFLPISTSGISGVGVGDFNGDHKLDLAACYRGVAVWLGHGDATFSPVTYYAGPSTPLSMAIEDFNADGFNDLAVVNPGLSVFHGKGDGTFLGRADFATANGAAELMSGDLDEDGRPDVAVACVVDAVSVLLNRTTVVDAPQNASRVFLAQSEPNPASETATIRFSLQQTGPASLRIYDVSGRVVATLFHGQATAGWHTASWDRGADRGAPSPAGVYFYELRTNEGRITKRMTALRR